MNASTIIRESGADGVILALSVTGTIKATGERVAVARWFSAIREHKAGIIEALKAGTTETAQCWRVQFADRGTCIATSGATRGEVVAWYPGASVAPHPPTSITPPPTRITFEQEAAIRAWLASIGETDPALIADTMNLANRDAVARGYLLERAESARETSRDCRDCASYPPTTARTARHSSDADGGAVRLTR